MSHARVLLEVTYLPPDAPPLTHVTDAYGVVDAVPHGYPAIRQRAALGVDLLVLDRSATDAPDAAGLPFQVRWSDRVINVWTESYADLAVALARAAALLRAVQRGALFVHQPPDDAQTLDGCAGPAEFVRDAATFLDDQLDPREVTG